MTTTTNTSTNTASDTGMAGVGARTPLESWRSADREAALGRALAKRAAGVPSYSVPEAAALLSVSQEHLYRLIRTGGFPSIRMTGSGTQGRYIVPAAAIERLLGSAAEPGAGCVASDEFTTAWNGTSTPGTPGRAPAAGSAAGSRWGGGAA